MPSCTRQHATLVFFEVATASAKPSYKACSKTTDTAARGENSLEDAKLTGARREKKRLPASCVVTALAAGTGASRRQHKRPSGYTDSKKRAYAETYAHHVPSSFNAENQKQIRFNARAFASTCQPLLHAGRRAFCCLRYPTALCRRARVSCLPRKAMISLRCEPPIKPMRAVRRGGATSLNFRPLSAT